MSAVFAHRLTLVTLGWLILAAMSVAVIIAMTIAGVVLDGFAGTWPLLLLGWPIVGGLVILKRPDNVVGRLLVVFGSPLSFSLAVEAYLVISLEHIDLPATNLAIWAWGWLFTPILFVLALLVSHFPTGRITSRWLRPLVWMCGVMTVFMLLGRMLSPVSGQMPGLASEVTNPWGIEMFEPYVALDEALGTAGIALLILVMVDLVIRWRRSSGKERLQMRWLALVAFIFAMAVLTSYLMRVLLDLSKDALNAIDTIGWLSGLALLPVAIGIAVVRYRLYDIDRIMSRTLSYASLTALLVLGFAGNILLFQFILSPFTSGNDLAIAASTLIVFALFRPLRGRLQMFVDRRFYRHKYDAEQTLQAFGITTRDAVDLDPLTSELTRIVILTMQPEHVAVWLRGLSAREDRR